ncbi:MAG: TonB-dependent receptor [Candidatus Omnitrophica bacterium]|nr:TonB-dependent receptor [Candidatus Omnitrophota bacterium]
MKKLRYVFAILIGVIALGAAPLFAADKDMMSMSLEDLLKTPVTSAGGREQKKNEVSQAMTVITREDIARSGARNVPDLFYMVPGMQVKRLNGHMYAVAVRGPAYNTTNNLLVLIDGTVVFNAGFNGTVWNNLPISLNEIERIEIIRGPGGVLYSSNAVNGVINIITRSAFESGNYVATKAGAPYIQDYALGVGAQNAGKDMGLRSFGQYKSDSGYSRKYKDPNPADTNGVTYNDEVRDSVAGMRYDQKFNADAHLTVTSALDTSHAYDRGFASDRHYKDLNGMEMAAVTFQQKVSDLYDYSLHTDVVHHRLSEITNNDSDVTTESVAMQHNLTYVFLGKHVTSFGAEVRDSQPDIKDAGTSGSVYLGTMNSGIKDLRIGSIFLQDEYRPWDKLVLTAGTRVERNSYTPKQNPLVSPRASAVYLLTDTQSVRAVVQKAYRTPSISERYLNYVPNYASGAYRYVGNLNLEPENVLTYEAGYHGLFLENKLELEATEYLSHVKDLILFSDSTYPSYPYISSYSDVGSLTTLGTEISAKLNITKELMWLADYGYITPYGNPDSRSHSLQEAATYVSTHTIGSGLRFTKNQWTFDVYGKYFSKYIYQSKDGNILAPGTGTKEKGYWDNTLRLGYKFRLGKTDAEAELVGQNLFGGPGQYQTYDRYLVQKEVYAGLKIDF